MVLDDYRQAYVGATDHPGGIMARIETSIISIDSFRALDTTRIFAAKTARSFDGENLLLDRFPRKFMLNRIVGGSNAVKLARLVDVDRIMKRRD